MGKVPFGKNKGKAFSEVPVDYLKGLLKCEFLWEKTRREIRAYLMKLWRDPGQLVVPFGKYQGQKLKEAETWWIDYTLDWMDEDSLLREFFQRELRVRGKRVLTYTDPVSGVPSGRGWVLEFELKEEPYSPKGFVPSEGFGGGELGDRIKPAVRLGFRETGLHPVQLRFDFMEEPEAGEQTHEYRGKKPSAWTMRRPPAQRDPEEGRVVAEGEKRRDAYFTVYARFEDEEEGRRHWEVRDGTDGGKADWWLKTLSDLDRVERATDREELGRWAHSAAARIKLIIKLEGESHKVLWRELGGRVKNSWARIEASEETAGLMQWE